MFNKLEKTIWLILNTIVGESRCYFFRFGSSYEGLKLFCARSGQVKTKYKSTKDFLETKKTNTKTNKNKHVKVPVVLQLLFFL